MNVTLLIADHADRRDADRREVSSIIGAAVKLAAAMPV